MDNTSKLNQCSLRSVRSLVGFFCYVKPCPFVDIETMIGRYPHYMRYINLI